MLWYKGWLETRWKVVFTLVIMLFWLHMEYGLRNPSLFSNIFPNIGFIYVLMGCMLLAGAGIATQPPFQSTKGLHGSMLFTLSLPVSRLRLLAVRASIGWLEMIPVVVVFCCGLWVVCGPARTIVSPVQMFEYGATMLACATPFYCLSVLLATFLDDQWRIWGTMLSVAGFFWLSHEFSLPAFADLLRAMGKGSPLVAHVVPWPAMAFSGVLAAGLLFASVKIVRTREY